jgi:hypothetical protein
MARGQLVALVVLALGVVACHASDDPTVTLKGVHDLSEWVGTSIGTPCPVCCLQPRAAAAVQNDKFEMQLTAMIAAPCMPTRTVGKCKCNLVAARCQWRLLDAAPQLYHPYRRQLLACASKISARLTWPSD